MDSIQQGDVEGFLAATQHLEDDGMIRMLIKIRNLFTRSFPVFGETPSELLHAAYNEVMAEEEGLCRPELVCAVATPPVKAMCEKFREIHQGDPNLESDIGEILTVAYQLRRMFRKNGSDSS
jgi:hypothetical protein